VERCLSNNLDQHDLHFGPFKNKRGELATLQKRSGFGEFGGHSLDKVCWR
jgi:hypothetical protein